MRATSTPPAGAAATALAALSEAPITASHSSLALLALGLENAARDLFDSTAAAAAAGLEVTELLPPGMATALGTAALKNDDATALTVLAMAPTIELGSGDAGVFAAAADAPLLTTPGLALGGLVNGAALLLPALLLLLFDTAPLGFLNAKSPSSSSSSLMAAAAAAAARDLGASLFNNGGLMPCADGEVPRGLEDSCAASEASVVVAPSVRCRLLLEKVSTARLKAELLGDASAGASRLRSPGLVALAGGAFADAYVGAEFGLPATACSRLVSADMPAIQR